MSASVTGVVPEKPSRSLLRKIAWHWRYDEKRELWIGWWTLVVFYNLYGLLFFVIARTQPPPQPSLDPSEIVQWFADRHDGLVYGYAIVFIVGGATAIMNATLAYTMRRMSVSRAFAYSYLVIYALATLPGMLIMGVACTVGAMRPDRDPELIGYLNLCNALTEVVVAPAWIFKSGAFAWNGAIAWWINMGVFVTYTIAFLTLLRRMILREDFGTGPLPELATARAPAPSGLSKATR